MKFVKMYPKILDNEIQKSVPKYDLECWSVVGT
jgi:hypothetical protein